MSQDIMYKVRGADGREYGPVTEQGIRQWIAEGRLNGESMICRVDEGVWRPLNQFPGFGNALGTMMESGATSSDSTARENALRKVDAPGLGLVVAGVLGVVMSLYGALQLVLQGAPGPEALPTTMTASQRQFMETALAFQGKYGLPMSVINLLFSALSAYGGMALRGLRSYPLALGGAMVAIMPCFHGCCCISLPLGLWALVVMHADDVRPHWTTAGR